MIVMVSFVLLDYFLGFSVLFHNCEKESILNVLRLCSEQGISFSCTKGYTGNGRVK